MCHVLHTHSSTLAAWHSVTCVANAAAALALSFHRELKVSIHRLGKVEAIYRDVYCVVSPHGTQTSARILLAASARASSSLFYAADSSVCSPLFTADSCVLSSSSCHSWQLCLDLFFSPVTAVSR